MNDFFNTGDVQRLRERMFWGWGRGKVANGANTTENVKMYHIKLN